MQYLSFPHYAGVFYFSADVAHVMSKIERFQAKGNLIYVQLGYSTLPNGRIFHAALFALEEAVQTPGFCFQPNIFLGSGLDNPLAELELCQKLADQNFICMQPRGGGIFVIGKLEEGQTLVGLTESDIEIANQIEQQVYQKYFPKRLAGFLLKVMDRLMK